MSINIIKVDFHPVYASLKPSLDVDVSFKNVNAQRNFFNIEGQLFIRDESNIYYIGRVSSKFDTHIEMNPNTDASARLHIDFSHNILNLIEDVRKNQKLSYKLFLWFYCFEANKPQRIRVEYDGVIEKSRWIEDILEKLGYAKIEYIDFRFNDLKHDERLESEVNHFRKAIKSYNDGDYDDVLVKCRQAINDVISRFGELGLAGNENIKRAGGTASHFLSLGAHGEGEIKNKIKIGRKDGEFALGTTLAFLRLITSYLPENK